ncbi:MAG: pyruvate/2-oxoglutarate/acetoin dehydrogenase E1 component, partial [Acidimicrobiales bacterium]
MSTPPISTSPTSSELRNEETLTLVSAINQTLMAEMRRDERIMVFGEDVARSGGVFRATEGLMAEFG